MELQVALNELGHQADQIVADQLTASHGKSQDDVLGRVMFGIYNVLLATAFPVILAILLWKKRCRSGLRQRLGWLPRSVAQDCRDGNTIWVHAVSMGEATAVVPLVQELKRRYPHQRIVVSTITETGKETVQRKLNSSARHIYFPLDFPMVVRKVLKTVRPRLFVVVETELWPNFLRAAARCGVPCVLVNGRLSTDSFRGYRRLRPFFQRVVQSFSLCLMQTERDVHRMLRLGADPSRVVVTGNLKFDQEAQEDSGSSIDLGLHADEELFVAGSTHPIEEEAVLDCYGRLLKIAPQLVLVIAPRHIERAETLVTTIRNFGFPALRRTLLPSAPGTQGPRVIILDTRGELAALYRQAVLVFVGGSLAPIGGHNPLEPASQGKGVVFGPHMDHFADVADLLISHGGGIQVKNAEQLATAMIGLMNDRAWLKEMGQRAMQVVQANQGTVSRNAALIAELLGTPAGNR